MSKWLWLFLLKKSVSKIYLIAKDPLFNSFLIFFFYQSSKLPLYSFLTFFLSKKKEENHRKKRIRRVANLTRASKKKKKKKKQREINEPLIYLIITRLVIKIKREGRGGKQKVSRQNTHTVRRRAIAPRRAFSQSVAERFLKAGAKYVFFLFT